MDVQPNKRVVERMYVAANKRAIAWLNSRYHGRRANGERDRGSSRCKNADYDATTMCENPRLMEELISMRVESRVFNQCSLDLTFLLFA